MGTIQVIWLAVAFFGAAVVFLLALATLRRQRVRPTPLVRTAWLVAALTSGTMFILTVAKVGDLIPSATVVDVGALAVTGVLTRVFLALSLKPSPSSGGN